MPTDSINRHALRALRHARGLSFRQLASECEQQAEVSVSYAHLANVENGRRPASRQVLDAVAKVLGVPLGALVHEGGAPEGAPPAERGQVNRPVNRTGRGRGAST